DPEQFTDRYEEALRAMIAAKEKGARPVSVAEPPDTKIVDLMAALARPATRRRSEPQRQRRRGGRRRDGRGEGRSDRTQLSAAFPQRARHGSARVGKSD